MFVASAARAAIYNFTPSAGVVTASYANHFVTLSISGQNSTNVPSESTQDISIHNGVVGWSSVSPPRVYSYVFDAARGKWIGTSSSDGPTYDLSSRDGVVAWSKSDLARAAFFRVYDPATGNWVSGSGTGPVVEPQVLNANGVVAWSTSTKANFRVYDPTRGGWRSGEANLSTRTSDLTTEGGVVAWSVNSTPTRVDYIVYDPLRGEWRGGAEVGAGFTTGLTVQDSQVTWTTSGGDFFRGYHGPNGAWIDGLPVALAYFAVSTDLGNAPFYVSFIDMSIGGTAWSWNFGDGTGPSFQRSTTYRYTTYGRFTATQTVNGSSTNRIIVTDTLPPAGTNVINGGATFTTNPVVTLTLLASDNSGVVANMRFSNTNGTWPGWESFAATKLWTLSPSNGTKTVFAQFLDSAGNTSATASASIQLDTTPPPTVSFVTTNVNESAGTVSLRAVLDHPYSQPVVVGYATANGTAAAPGDYVSTSGTLTFASNLTSASFSLTIQPDSVVELNETVLINFTAISNVVAGPPGTLTILDDDLASVSFAADNFSALENSGSAAIIVRLSAPSGRTVSVRCTATNGVATPGIDFTPVEEIVTFAPGQTNKTFFVPIIDDSLDELPETVDLFLSPVVNAVPGALMSATLTILDDDKPLVFFRTNTFLVYESEGAAEVEVWLSKPFTEQVTVHYTASGGTATPGIPGDYLATSGSLTFSPGVTNLTFFVNLIDDATAERDETVHLRLSNLQNASPGPRMEADLLIRDDDGPPILASAKLGTNNHFNLTFTGKIGQPFRVDASTNLPAWFLIARLTNTTGTLEYTDPTPAIGPRRFYRTALLP